MEKAILIPVNPKIEFMRGPEGSIGAYEKRILERGAVFWRLIAPGEWVAAEFPHPEIRSGYLYDMSVRMVTHACDISWIKPASEVPFEDNQKYGMGKYHTKEEYDEDSELFYVLRIKSITRLAQLKPLSEFLKFKDGQPVKLVRNYCIVRDSM